MLRISGKPKPGIGTAWCAPFEGEGAPIVTTSDDNGANPIVWIVGAEGDNRLHGYRGDTGKELTNVTGETMQGSATSLQYWLPRATFTSPRTVTCTPLHSEH